MDVRLCRRVPPLHTSPLKTTCTSRKKRDSTAAAALQFSAAIRTMKKAKEVCAYEKRKDHRRFSAAGTFFFGLCKCRLFRWDAIFGENGNDRACAKHCAAGAHNRFCFGKYRDFRREHRRTRNGGNTAPEVSIPVADHAKLPTESSAMEPAPPKASEPEPPEEPTETQPQESKTARRRRTHRTGV